MKKAMIIVSVLLLVLVSFRMVRFYEKRMNEETREKLEKAYYDAVLGDSVKAVGPIGLGGKKAAAKPIGRILIPSVGIDYVIMDKTTEQNLDISITKVVGPAINEKGNLVLAGHNMKNGSLFGKLKKAKKKEVIVLEDMDGVKKEYRIVEKYKVNEKDLSPLDQNNKNESMITLITCTTRSNERLIVVGKR